MSEQDIVPLRLLDLEMRIQKLADKLDAVALSVRNISDELSVMQDKLTAFEERIKIYLEPDTCHMQEIFGMGSIWEESSPAASPEFPNA